MTIRPVAAVLIATAALHAQGEAYAFDERKPKTPLERVIDSKLPSLVKIHGASGLSTIIPYATGVIVSEQGHILTADLVMIQRDKTRVVLHDGSVHQAELLPPDDDLRVRLLKIDPTAVDHPLVPLKAATEIPVNGTFVVSLGNCFRLAEFSEKLSATFGVVVSTASTGLRYRMQDVDYDGRLILTDAPNNPGHVGGGLFTLTGEWIGLNTRVVESTETNTQISAAIPAGDLTRYIDRWVGDGTGLVVEDDDEPITPGYHGIVLFDRGGRRSPPAYVERTRRRSPGRTLGLRPDDLIVRIDDHAVRSCAEFGRVMARFPAGATIAVTYKRGTKVLRGTMTLEEAR